MFRWQCLLEVQSRELAKTERIGRDRLPRSNTLSRVPLDQEGRWWTARSWRSLAVAADCTWIVDILPLAASTNPILCSALLIHQHQQSIIIIVIVVISIITRDLSLASDSPRTRWQGYRRCWSPWRAFRPLGAPFGSFCAAATLELVCRLALAFGINCQIHISIESLLTIQEPDEQLLAIEP